MKKYLALLLALSMLCSLAGCSTEGQTDGPGNTSKPASQGDGHSHSYEEAVVEPSCIEPGYTLYTCSCGHSYSGNETAALGHNYADMVCQRCGHKNIPSQGLTYELIDNGTAYSLTGIGTCTDLDLVVPAEYEGLPVTDIGESAFRDCSMLTSVSLPEGLEYIGMAAFSGCSSLATLMIPSSVNRIRMAAFQKCKSLTSIVLPESLTELEDSLFSGCTNLARVTASKNLTSIGSQTFYNCENLAGFTIPDSVTFMGNLAFSGCPNLLQQEGCITYVGKWVLSCDEAVTEVALREDTVGIAQSAFSDCTKLTSISIPDTVIGIGDYAFYGCTSLKTVRIPNINTVESSMFSGCTSLTEVEICEGVTEIHPNAFNNCTSLVHITIPGSVTLLEFALHSLHGLERIDFGGTMEAWSTMLTKSNIGVRCTVYCIDGEIPCE